MTYQYVIVPYNILVHLPSTVTLLSHRMKLAVCLLFSLAALVSSDSSYSHYQQYQQYPTYDQSAPSASNYYQAQQYPQAQRRQSFME